MYLIGWQTRATFSTNEKQNQDQSWLACTCVSRALRGLHALSLNSDCFIAPFTFVVIGQCNNFGFGLRHSIANLSVVSILPSNLLFLEVNVSGLFITSLSRKGVQWFFVLLMDQLDMLWVLKMRSKAPVSQLVNADDTSVIEIRELKQRRRQRQRKRHPKICLYFICATSRLFQLAQLLQKWRTIQEPNW